MSFRLSQKVVPAGGVPAYFDATFGTEAGQLNLVCCSVIAHVLPCPSSLVVLCRFFCQELLRKFASWIDVTFPPNAAFLGCRVCIDLFSAWSFEISDVASGLRIEYASSFTPGACYIRPHQLGYRSDFGYSGLAEPDSMLCLVQLYMSEGRGSQPRKQ